MTVLQHSFELFRLLRRTVESLISTFSIQSACVDTYLQTSCITHQQLVDFRECQVELDLWVPVSRLWYMKVHTYLHREMDMAFKFCP